MTETRNFYGHGASEMASFATEMIGNPGDDPMGKTPSKRTAVHKYFPKTMYVGSNETVISRFERALAELNESGGLSMLDQKKMTQQTLLATLMLWLSLRIDAKGVRAVEKEMRPVIEELGKIVAQEMASRGREVDPGYLPPGFKITRKAKRPDRDSEN